MDLEPQLVAIPLYIALMALEAFETWRERRSAVAAGRDPRSLGYAPRDTATSLAMGIGSVIVGFIVAGASVAVAFAIYQFRVVDLGAVADGVAGWGWAVLAWAFLVIADDFIYYWQHRINHRVRIFWAAHVVHHSSQRYNLSTALRQPWADFFLGVVLSTPLFLLGFTPAQWAVVHGFNLIYQFWIHTEVIDKLWRPIELVFNTPSHHRVHHGTNSAYLDKNYGGILIVFDRMFGTFEAEGERVVYGLTKNISTYNPLRVFAHEYAAIGRDLQAADSWGERSRIVLGPPRAA